ncbi:germination protein, Ger(x)C family [Clostridiales bacterium oral taxon 876 str. F0540]|nr:germination protein, Ger(x)C family [Clostridiales bacterium oral taxon 876 str. F0540]
MKKILALLLVFNTIFLSGCWDEREINDLGLVMAVGIDKKKGSPLYTVTAQIAKPSSASGQGGKSGGGDQPVWLGSADGKTIFEAIRNLAKFSSRRVMWAHNNIIVIGESLAEQDITPVVDFFTQNPELRMKTWVAISHGDAKPYITAKTGLENIPGISIAELFRYHELPSESVATDMLRLFRDYKSESQQPLVSALNLKTENTPNGPNQVELEGAAVLKRNKLVGWLSPEETKGIAWVRNEMKNGIIVVTGVGKEEQNISVEIRDAKSKITAQVSGDMPSINIKVEAKGDISEFDSATTLSIEELKSQVEKEACHVIERQIKQGLDKVQKQYKSDVLGFGRAVHISDKEDWYKTIQDKWEEIYPQVPVSINVALDIRTSSLYQEPINIEKKKRKE